MQKLGHYGDSLRRSFGPVRGGALEDIPKSLEVFP